MSGRKRQISDELETARESVETPSARRAIEQKSRRAEAVSMALAGLTYEQIGERLNVSPSRASRLVNDTIAQTRNYAVDQLRDIENARLDRAQAAIWTRVIEGDDKAIGMYLRIAERRAKLNGLDAPAKVQMAVSIRQEMETALESLREVILEAEEEDDGSERDVVADEEAAAFEQDYGMTGEATRHRAEEEIVVDVDEEDGR